VSGFDAKSAYIHIWPQGKCCETLMSLRDWIFRLKDKISTSVLEVFNCIPGQLEFWSSIISVLNPTEKDFLHAD
jgi:hypothetical protein